jgi:hypothetical protein
MALNPLTYGMAALRRCLYWSGPDAAGAVPGLGISLLVTVVFCVATLAAATATARRSRA